MFSTDRWFRDFTSWLAQDRARRRDILEVLSDSANEFHCNALTAMHLRRHGRAQVRGGMFWARCEWEKADITYGLAKSRFADWGKGRPHATGDIGTIEGKVLYGHWPPGEMRPPVRALRVALERRRTRHIGLHGSVYVNNHRYHGLVWLFDHMQPQKRRGPESERLAFDLLRDEFGRDAAFVVVAREEMRDLWPLESHKTSYVPELRVALLQLP